MIPTILLVFAALAKFDGLITTPWVALGGLWVVGVIAEVIWIESR